MIGSLDALDALVAKLPRRYTNELLVYIAAVERDVIHLEEEAFDLRCVANKLIEENKALRRTLEREVDYGYGPVSKAVRQEPEEGQD